MLVVDISIYDQTVINLKETTISTDRSIKLGRPLQPYKHQRQKYIRVPLETTYGSLQSDGFSTTLLFSHVHRCLQYFVVAPIENMEPS